MKASIAYYLISFILAGFVLFGSIQVNAQTITTVAGNGTQGYLGDVGPQTAAEFWNPTGVAVDGQGNIFIADQHNDRIREVLAKSDSVFTVVGDSIEGYYPGTDTLAKYCHLYGPTSIVLDTKSNIYIADQYNNRIRKVSSTTGYITTIAGNGKAGFSGDGTKADTVNTSFFYPVSLAIDTSGNIYVVDSYNNRIRKITASTGIITTIAGYTTPVDTALIDTSWGYSGDGGLATLAKYNSINAVTLDPAGNIYLVDGGNNCIRKITAATGIVTTVAGTGDSTSAYSGDDGPATKARLASPDGIAVDTSGNIFIADAGNNVIRMVIAKTGIIRTVAGNGTAGYTGDGFAATDAELYNPMAMAFDTKGNLYIADEFNSVIRKVTATTLGINPTGPLSKEISVFPVPNKGSMTLKLNGSGYSSVHVLNSLGQSIYDLTLSTMLQDQYLSINLPDAACGMYVIQIISKESVISRSIVINK